MMHAVRKKCLQQQQQVGTNHKKQVSARAHAIRRRQPGAKDRGASVHDRCAADGELEQLAQHEQTADVPPFSRKVA